MSSSPDRSCIHDRDQASVLEVSCPNCKRRYRIRRSRIPAQASAVFCKDCGRKIRLHQTSSDKSSHSRNQSIRPRFRLDLMTPEKRPSRGRLRRKNT
ncbi:MAG: zinc-ribbon domain-containing protein [Hyphomicrobiales bacterium]